MKTLITAIVLSITSLLPVVFAGPTPAPKDAYLYIGWPNDGEVLPANRPFLVWFGLRIEIAYPINGLIRIS